MAITTQMRTDVANLYVALFGRAPEADGLGYWVTQMGNGVSLSQVAQSMYDTTPARAFYPSFLTNEEVVERFYTNVLGRTPDAEGKAYWAAKLNAGASKGAVIAEMITAVVNYAGTDADALASKALFDNKVDVSLYYAVTLGGNDVSRATSILTGVSADASTVTAAKTAAATVSGSTFTLSTGADTVTGTSGNDTIYGSLVGGITTDSLQAFDQIAAGAGTDTLNVALTGASYDGTATISGVEAVVARATGAARSFAFGNLTGVTSVTNDRSATDLTVTGVDSAATAIVVDRMTSGADTNVEFAKAALAGTTTAASVTLKGVAVTGTASEVNLYGAAGTTDGIETLNLSSSGDASYLSKLTVADTSGGNATMSKLVFSGSSNVTVTTALDFAGTKGTIDASTATGGLSVLLDTAENVTITGGAGNDSFNFGTGLTTDDSVDGGAGTDTVRVKQTSFTLANYKISNTEVIDQQAADGANNLTMTTGGTALSKVVLREVSNASNQSVTVSDLAAGVAVDLVQSTDSQQISAANLGLKDASGTADALTVTLKGVAGHGAADNAVTDLVFTNVETLNLVSSTTGTTALAAADANTVSDISTDTALTKIVATGSSALAVTVGAEATKLATFDGSALTGDLSVTLQAGDVSVSGGSGDDTFVFGATLNNKDTVVGGGNTASSTEDTLTATVTGLTATTGVLNVSGVERLNLTNAGTAVINAAAVTGATEIGLASGGTSTTISGLSSSTAVGLGFKGVDPAGNQAYGTVTLSLADETGTADSVTVNLNAVDTANAGDTHTVTLKTTAIETVNLKYSSTATELASYTVTATNLKAGTINVSGSDADTGNTVALGTVNAATTKIDGSTFKGVLTATAASGVATTFLANGTKANNLTGSTASDTFTIGSTTATQVLDGGAGNDALNITLANGNVDLGSVQNFETINVTVGASAAVALTAVNALEDSDLTKLTITGGNTLSTIENSTDSIAATSSLATVDMSGFQGAATLYFADDKLTSATSITGAVGKDTVDAIYSNSAQTLKMSGVETVRVTNSGGASSFDLASVTGMSTLMIKDATNGSGGITLTNFDLANTKLQLGTGIDNGVTTTDVDVAVTVTGASTTGAADVLNVVVQNIEGTAASVAANGVETINLSVATDAASAQTISVSDTNATNKFVVNVTDGTSGFGLTLGSVSSDATKVDASSFIGDLTFSASARAGSTAMTITGGTGADALNMKHYNDVIDGGTGTDSLSIVQNAVLGGFQVDLSSTVDQVTTFNGSANSAVQKGFENVDLSGVTGVFGADVTANSAGSTITGTTNADVITLGAGADVVVYAAAKGGDTINGFAVAADIIKFNNSIFDGANYSSAATFATKVTAAVAGGAGTSIANADLIVWTANNTVITAAGVETALAAQLGTFNGAGLIATDDGTNTFLWYDADVDTDNGGADVTLIATLNGVADAGTLGLANFTIV